MRASWIIILLVGCLCGCGPRGETNNANSRSIAVGIEPLRFFADRITGGAIDVVVMVPPNASPVTYEPKPKQMSALAEAALYFEVGVPFERAWVPRFAGSNKALKVVKLSKGIDKIPMASHSHPEDDHGHAHHEHGADCVHGDMLDPHIWLSARLALTIGDTMVAALSAQWPEMAADFEANWAATVIEIKALDERLTAQFKDAQGAAFLVYHPSWGYFAKDYGLRQVAVEIAGGEPRPAQLKQLIDQARAEQVKAILVQPQFNQRSAGTVAEAIGAKVLTADPLDGNWLKNLEAVAGHVREAMGDSHGEHKH